MVASHNIRERIIQLENSALAPLEEFDSDDMILAANPNIKSELAELYYLRDLNMELDPTEQIVWSLRKLTQWYKFHDLLAELSERFEGSNEIYEFYKACSLEALIYLGY